MEPVLDSPEAPAGEIGDFGGDGFGFGGEVGIFGIELQRSGVQAVAFSGWSGPVVKDVAEMTAASSAADFGSRHVVA